MYTQHLGGWKRNQNSGWQCVRGSFLSSHLLPTISLPFISLPSIMKLIVLQTIGPAVVASKQAEVSGRRCQNKSIPVRSIHIAGVGTRERVPQPCPPSTGIHLLGLFSFALLPKDKKSQREVTDHGKRQCPLACWSYQRDPLMGNCISPGHSTTHHGQSFLGGTTVKTPEPHRHSLRMLENLHMLAH